LRLCDVVGVYNRISARHEGELDAVFAERLEANVAIIDQLYPKMRVDLVIVKGAFSPEV
jgi:hypothetical protein